MSNELILDKIGEWSKVKLEVIEAYISFYMKIMKAPNQADYFRTLYIDAFAGAGFNISREGGDKVPGSTMKALAIKPTFDEYIFIEKNPSKVQLLRSHCSSFSHAKTEVHEGDCNDILTRDLFPRFRQNKRLRAVLLVDPYGLQYDWDVIAEAGATKAVDLILNFPMMGAQRAGFWRNPDELPTSLRRRFQRTWGADKWSEAYTEVPNLLANDPDYGPELVKKGCREIAEILRKRIRDNAGFKHVAQPHPSKNNRGSILFFLFLASQKPVAEKVMNYIVQKQSEKGV